MRGFLSLSLVLFVFQAHAKESDVIDLGSLEVQGQVRQPPIQFYQPKVIPSSVLQNVSEETFGTLESSILTKNKSLSSKTFNAQQAFQTFEKKLVDMKTESSAKKGKLK